ncbi:MAG TPA: hypothetical protein VL155_11775 [Terriglobales bacterium]|jgi:hypothetical protein|nr:hypothetical protein [Terriglobales bacterium]
MQRSLTYALAAVLLTWAVALAQPTPPAAQAAPQAGPTLAPGIVLGAELSKGVDAKKAKVGQEVVAKSLADLRDNNGNLVIPRGAKLVGHVTEVKAATKQEPQSTLGVIFDKVEAKHGKESKEIGMHAAIQALAKPQPSAMMDQPSGAEAPGGGPGGGTMGGAQPSMGSGGGRNMGGAPPGQTGDMGGGNMGGPVGQQEGGRGPSINANSHGAMGFPNLTLSPQASPTEGSIISSTKGNVKLDEGTLLVLRVMGQ